MRKWIFYRDEEYLAHHGIKGQKWGIRRYQNEDGTLTNEGKKRYLQGDSSTRYINIVQDIDKIGENIVKKYPDLKLEFDDGDYENFAFYAKHKYNVDTKYIETLIKLLDKIE